jgi:3',5'-cyclic-AMP phosphodiesterase
VPRPFLLAQLTDLHIGAEWGGVDPAVSLAAAVDSLRRLPDLPDAVVVTGDIANDGTDDQYATAGELLARIGLPLHVLPGNHDDRAALRRRFGGAGEPTDPIHYAVDLGRLRLVALDTTDPGKDPGRLDSDELDWLEAELGQAPDAPTLLALHHPPVTTGVPIWDSTALPVATAHALAAVLGRHPQVRRLAAGHLHRTLVAEISGRSVLAAPSTSLQARLDFSAEKFEMVPEPPGYVIHAVLDGQIVSHVQPVG